MQAGTHPRVLGYLGRALSLELSAVQQYMTQASLLSLWGQAAAAERFRLDTAEEMQHAQRLVEHMLLLTRAGSTSEWGRAMMWAATRPSPTRSQASAPARTAAFTAPVSPRTNTVT